MNLRLGSLRSFALVEGNPKSHRGRSEKRLEPLLAPSSSAVSLKTEKERGDG